LEGVGTNRYAYAGNDPINKSDPNGHQSLGYGYMDRGPWGDYDRDGIPNALERGYVETLKPDALQDFDIAGAAAAVALLGILANIENEEKDKKTRNPHGSKGKQDHQDKVAELEEKAISELNPGERALREQKALNPDINRFPDVQIVNEDDRIRKAFEAERHPNRKRNQKREEEYDSHDIENETHGVGEGEGKGKSDQGSSADDVDVDLNGNR
jgi:hypothetical protein